MVGSTRGWLGFLTVVGLVAGCAGLFRSAPLLPTYAKVLTLGPRIEWRFNPLALDLNRDGHLDLVATARLAKPALHMWVGDGKVTFTSRHVDRYRLRRPHQRRYYSSTSPTAPAMVASTRCSSLADGT